MKNKFLALTALFAMLVLLTATAIGDEPDNLVPDTVYLKSGGELHGQVQGEIRNESDGRLYVIIHTASGGLLKLDKARLISHIQLADELDTEYQRRLAIAGDDPELNWKLYQWCSEQPSGAIRFKSQMHFLLNRIIELAPNDQRARRLLGFQQIDGQWVLKAQWYGIHGYFKDGTSWAPDLQQAVTQQSAAFQKMQGERKSALARWLRDVKTNRLSHAQLEQELFSFCDEIGLPIILHQEAKSEPNPAIRLMYIEAFGRVPAWAANQALVHFAVTDPDGSVRDRALTLLEQPIYDHAASVRLMTGYFGASDNAAIRQAALVMGALGTENAIMPLIGALVTKHTVAITGNEPGRMKTSFGSGGSGLSTGGGPQSQDILVKNDESRVALNRITGQHFGYDEAAWKQWYLENHTLYDARVRADE